MIKMIDEITKEMVRDAICLPYYEKVQICSSWYKVGYVPIGFSFKTKKDCMYIWAMTIRDLTIVGSKWTELKDLITMIELYTYDSVFPIYNFGFGSKFFHYVRGTLGIVDGFVRGAKIEKYDIFDPYYPDALYAVIDNSLLFIDSHEIAPMSREELAEAYCTTKLSEGLSNVDACIKESIIDKEFSEFVFNEYFLPYKHLPVTQNQIIKDAVNAEFNRDKDTNREIIKGLFPNKSVYVLVRYFGFRGGFVLSSDKDRTGDIVCDDLESAYTAAAVHGYFPMSKYERVPSQYFRQYLDVKCCQLHITFINLRPKHKWMTYDSCNQSTNPKEEMESIEVNRHSKIIFAPKFTTSLTELDFKLYEKIYIWEKIIVHECWVADRGSLPEYALKAFLKFYGVKSYLKLTGKKGTPEYARAKTMPSTVFGYSSQKLVTDEDLESLSNNAWYHKFKTKKMMPQWGVYITAHVRYWIMMAAIAMGEYAWLYSDTDSLWHDNTERSKNVVDKFNAEMKKRNIKLCEKFNLDPKIYMTLGCLDNEGKVYDRFKTIGSKSYLAHLKGTPEEPVYDKKGKVTNYKLVLAGIQEDNFWKCCMYYLPEVEGDSVMDKIFNYFTENSPIIYYKKQSTLRFNVVEEINGIPLYERIAVHEEETPIKTTIRQAAKTASINYALEQMAKNLI